MRLFCWEATTARRVASTQITGCDEGKLPYEFELYDDEGDGWSGAQYTISDKDDKEITTGTLLGGFQGKDDLCLAKGAMRSNLHRRVKTRSPRGPSATLRKAASSSLVPTRRTAPSRGWCAVPHWRIGQATVRPRRESHATPDGQVHLSREPSSA